MTFTSVEQYIMYRKCVIFGDSESAAKCLDTEDPAVQQQLGRDANGYNETVWNGLRQAVALRALTAKFTQNDTLRTLLLSTGGAFLVEAAHDPVWGCGISLYSENRHDIGAWVGTNLLGFALMEVRSALRRRLTPNKKQKCLSRWDGTLVLCFIILQ